jgi:hypothetical protein
LFDWLSCRVAHHQPDGILGHGEGFSLIFTVGDDFRERRNADGEAAFFLGFQHDGECARLIQCGTPFAEMLDGRAWRCDVNEWARSVGRSRVKPGTWRDIQPFVPADAGTQALLQS